MNTKTFLSACLLSLTALSCQSQAPLMTEESCPIDEPSVIMPHIAPLAALPASAPASIPVEVIEPTPEEPKAMPTQLESELRFVLTPTKKPLIALQRGDNLVATGKPTWVAKKDVRAVRREVELSSLPESSAAWLGQAVKLYKKDGSFCEAKVTGLSILGQVNVYNDSPDRNSAAKMFKRSEERGGLRLVGELDIEECEGALFARLASLPAPEIVFPEKASKELRKQVLPKMRALSTYKTVQANYKEHLASYSTEANPKWTRWESLYDATPTVVTLQTKTRTVVLASMQQDGGCGDFSGALFSLWELNDDGSLTLLYQGEDFISPDFALDVDGDQTLELFQNSSWHQLKSGHYETSDDLYVPFEEDVCGC